MKGAILLLIGAIAILAMIVGVLWAINSERKAYNNGICTKCGGKLRLFDCDSQGGRGYHCDGCDNIVWVSYNVDKRK